MKLFKIALSNIRKRKGAAATLFAITLIAALVLSISLSLLFNVGNFHDEKRKMLNTPDLSVAMMTTRWDDSMADYAENYAGVRAVQATDSLIGDIEYTLGGTERRGQMSLNDDSVSREMGGLRTVIDRLRSKPADSIVLPLAWKYNGVRAGGVFTMKVGRETHAFTVYGFFEDAELGGAMVGIKPVYVTREKFAAFQEDMNLFPYRCLSVQFTRPADAYAFEAAFKNVYDLNNAANVIVMTEEGSKTASTMFSTIMSLVLILVAVIVLVIALIIMRFSIRNSMEEDIKTLGALKSIGYTARQIILSTLMQFGLLALTGSIAGVLLALAVSPYVGNIVTSTSGLLWNGASMFPSMLLSVLFVAAVTVLVAVLAARKARTITPVNALRQGLSAHTFRHNFAPLDSTKLPPAAALSLKHFMVNLKTNIVVFVMMILFAALGVLAGTLYHNFVVDISAFKVMVGFEPAGVMLMTADAAFAAEKFDEIAVREHVEKGVTFTKLLTESDGKMATFYVWADVMQRETSTLVEGRYPGSADEVSITASMRRIFGKKTGDMMTLVMDGKQYSYLITGITQGAGDTSTCGDMTLSGAERLKPDVVLDNMYLYLDSMDSAVINDFIAGLALDYGRSVIAINYPESGNNLFTTIEEPVAITIYLIVGLTVFTICFSTFLMVSTIIRRNKKSAGIMKALGFTSRQLILEMLLSFLPAVVLGTGVGLVLGLLTTNPLLGLVFGIIGIAKATFILPPVFTAVATALQLVVCLATVCLVSLRYRRIVPQKLITAE